MKLSDAIRLGAMLHPQAFNSRAAEGSCALRAAANALGLKDNRLGFIDYHGLIARWSHLESKAACPSSGCFYASPNTLLCVIFHVNDFHHWSRERIADWIATIEPADAPPAPATTTDAVARCPEVSTV